MHIERIMMVRPGKRFERLSFGQPLGLLYLISSLREKHPGKYQVELIEQALYDLSPEQVGERIRSFDPHLICMSCLSFEGNQMHQVAAKAKAIKPDVPVILGGPHGTVFWDYALEDPNIDVVAIGEGELTFLDLLDALEHDRPLSQVKGIAFRDKGQARKSEPREFIEDLDSLPFPAWDMVDFEMYGRQMSMNAFTYKTPWSMIFTSRACPFRCRYCHGIFGKKVRSRSPENVIEELKLLTGTYGIKELHIVDDIFNLPIDRAKRICEMIVDNDIDIKIAFPNGIRGDMMDRELIRKLKAAGCYTVTYAVETASARMQKKIDKNLNLEKIRDTIEMSFEEGLIPQAFFMMGFPGETLTEMKMTLDFALTSKLIRAWFFQVVVYPRTGLYEMVRESYPDMDLSSWKLFDLHYWAFTPFYTQATSIDLYKLQTGAYRRFFIRPWAIFMILRRFPKNRAFFRGIGLGIRASFKSIYQLQARVGSLLKSLSERLGSAKA